MFLLLFYVTEILTSEFCAPFFLLPNMIAKRLFLNQTQTFIVLVGKQKRMIE
jgi:hypothetical protein